MGHDACSHQRQGTEELDLYRGSSSHTLVRGNEPGYKSTEEQHEVLYKLSPVKLVPPPPNLAVSHLDAGF